MDPIGTLRGEHRLIERVLLALERFARAQQPLSLDDLRDFVRFCREFVDGCHHGKEEDILFAAMVEEGVLPVDMGPIAAMLDEHEQGRHAIRQLAQMAESAEGGVLPPDQRALLSETVGGYLRMLRQHILKEDSVLYPMAEVRLPEAVMAEIAQQFDRFEQRAVGERQALSGLAESLCARYQ